MELMSWRKVWGEQILLMSGEVAAIMPDSQYMNEEAEL
jgi:hypothetical protein